MSPERAVAAPREIRRVALMVNAYAPGRIEALERALELAGEGCALEATEEEARRLGVEAPAALSVVADDGPAPDLCLVLGGDGTILRALRQYAGTGVPVFAVNFGITGFLATVEQVDLDDGLRRALGGEFEVMPLPGLELAGAGGEGLALNDVTFTRRPRGPVAELAYSLSGEEVGHVRCDGLVAATPAGSTGYNLANGGPVMAWGVEGYAVSFVAPHTLTARALVVDPGSALHVRNAASRGAVDVLLDGQHAGDLEVGEEVEVRFRDAVSNLAQLPESNFYRRMREKFGRLAQ